MTTIESESHQRMLTESKSLADDQRSLYDISITGGEMRSWQSNKSEQHRTRS